MNTSTKWRDVQHTKEARIDALAGVRAGADVVRPENIFKESSVPGSFKRYFIKTGDQFGELTAIEIVEKHPLRGNLWSFRCACGKEARAYTGTVTKAARRGSTPSCSECREQLHAGIAVKRRELLGEAYRKQWIDRRTLYLPHQTLYMMAKIREDLEEEFGECSESAPTSFSTAPGWPYSHAHTEAAASAKAFHKKKEEARGAWTDDLYAEAATPLTPEERVALCSISEKNINPRQKPNWPAQKSNWPDKMKASLSFDEANALRAEKMRTVAESMLAAAGKSEKCIREDSAWPEGMQRPLVHLGIKHEPPVIYMRCGETSHDDDGRARPVQWIEAKLAGVTCIPCLDGLESLPGYENPRRKH